MLVQQSEKKSLIIPILDGKEPEAAKFVSDSLILIEEYRQHEATRNRLKAEYPTPHTGGCEYDYLSVRDNMDWRWAEQRQSEIEQEIGRMFLESATGINS